MARLQVSITTLLALSSWSRLSANVQAQSTAASAAACSSTIAPSHAAPSVAPGFSVQVVASGLTNPRGILFDSGGHLLVVQQGKGIVSLELADEGGACVRAGEPQHVIVDEAFNHGIALSADGRTLYASTPNAVFSWAYDPNGARNTSAPREIVGQMGDPNGHVTRTLLVSRQVPDMLLVSRGSMSNLDPAALDMSTGVSTIKAFNVSNVTSPPYNFAQDGILLGWGLRNSVGVAEEPVTGGIYSVENSVDNLVREGVNIHQNNPGEELNFHGYLNGTHTAEQGGNHGYPSCFAAWDVSSIPQNKGIDVGTQFAIGDQNATINDTFCRDDRVAPRLTFGAHMAPLDIKFNDNGSAAWVSFHGSWNRDTPTGYKLSLIPFDSHGSPTSPPNTKTPTIDIVTNHDLSKCPDQCFRPVGLAWDAQGRLFMSSDSTGEIYVVVSTGGTPPSTGYPPSTTASVPWTGGAGRVRVSLLAVVLVVVGVFLV